jgi:UDP-glucose 4-epimerase
MAVCLVAGGAGFLGSHLVEALVARGESVRILDNFSQGCPANLAAVRSDVDVVPGDLRSLTTVQKVMAGVDRVFHFAVPWAASPADPLHSPVGAQATWHLLLAARDAGCGQVVLASSGDVYGPGPGPVTEDDAIPVPPLPMGKHALLAEQEALAFSRSFGIGLVRLRFFNVFGPRQGRKAPGPNVGRILEAMVVGTRPVLYDHELEPVDLLYVEDAIRACLLAAEEVRTDGGVFNIGRGRPAFAKDVVSRLNAHLGSDLPPVLAGPCSTVFPNPIPDTSRAHVELGFAADVSLDEGLRRCADAYRAAVVEAAEDDLFPNH